MINFFPGVTNGDVMTWIIITIITLIAINLFAFISKKFLRIWVKKTKTTLDDRLLKAAERSLMVIAIVVITYMAAADLQYFKDHGAIVKIVLMVMAVFGGAYVIHQFINAILGWYGEEIALKTETDLDDIFVPILKNIVAVAIYVIATLVTLSQLGISITPLLAGLGIASLALGLALKDPLSEFLAGFYIMADRSVKKGDLVKLDTGDEGFVEEFGWRTSKIRTYLNNMIVVPNTKLATSIIQNYDSPETATSFRITGGVSYEANLPLVKKTLKEVAEKVIKNTEGAVKDFEPIVRFSSFGDSNIEFFVVLRAEDYMQRHTIIDEFIMQTKSEFDKNGIEINYPARKIYYAKSNPVESKERSTTSSSVYRR